MASGSLGNPTTIVSSYTPTFIYSDSTAPTVANIVATFAIYDSRLMVLTMRFNVTSKGSPSQTSMLQISIPSMVKLATSSLSTFGVYYSTSGPTNLVIRGNIDSSYLTIANGIGGGYSAPAITTGYQGLFAVIPVKPA